MTVLPAGAAALHGAATPAAATAPSFGPALRARSLPAAPAPAPAPPSPGRTALFAVERARERLDAVLAAARRGHTFTAQELLTLQADAYRYSQTLDLVSKVAEQCAQTVRQAVNTQV